MKLWRKNIDNKNYQIKCDLSNKFFQTFCSDEGASFPIVQGCRTSRSTVYYFRHNDMDHLEQLLIEQEKRDQQVKIMQFFSSN